MCVHICSQTVEKCLSDIRLKQLHVSKELTYPMVLLKASNAHSISSLCVDSTAPFVYFTDLCIFFNLTSGLHVFFTCLLMVTIYFVLCVIWRWTYHFNWKINSVRKRQKSQNSDMYRQVATECRKAEARIMCLICRNKKHSNHRATTEEKYRAKVPADSVITFTFSCSIRECVSEIL
jgi:hypothetical protein